MPRRIKNARGRDELPHTTERDEGMDERLRMLLYQLKRLQQRVSGRGKRDG